jgi:hypothetical protein
MAAQSLMRANNQSLKVKEKNDSIPKWSDLDQSSQSRPMTIGLPIVSIAPVQ